MMALAVIDTAHAAGQASGRPSVMNAALRLPAKRGDMPGWDSYPEVCQLCGVETRHRAVGKASCARSARQRE